MRVFHWTMLYQAIRSSLRASCVDRTSLIRAVYITRCEQEAAGGGGQPERGGGGGAGGAAVLPVVHRSAPAHLAHHPPQPGGARHSQARPHPRRRGLPAAGAQPPALSGVTWFRV
eukprot:3286381-Pyramimonas_sp.AAC.2